jgi:hypothetical protein
MIFLLGPAGRNVDASRDRQANVAGRMLYKA